MPMARTTVPLAASLRRGRTAALGAFWMLLAVRLFSQAEAGWIGSRVENPTSYAVQGHELLLQGNGDLNGDGIADTAAVFAPRGERLSREPCEARKRLLLVFLSGGEGCFRLAAVNPDLVPCYGADGNFPESLVDLAVKDGGLGILLYGGFAERWGREILFRWDAPSGDLLLAKDETEWFRADEPDRILRRRAVDVEAAGRPSVREYKGIR